MPTQQVWGEGDLCVPSMQGIMVLHICYSVNVWHYLSPKPYGNSLKELPLMALFLKTDLNWQWVNKIQILVQDLLLHYGSLLGGMEEIQKLKWHLKETSKRGNSCLFFNRWK